MRHLRALPRLTSMRLLLALLVLGLLARPTLAAVGEIHELGHAGATHLHAMADTGVGAHEAGAHHDEAEAGGAGLLHTLLHFAHCCGHVPALPSVSTAAAFAAHPGTALLACDARAQPSAPLLSPFRPPISA